MPSISVDDEVFAALQQRGKAFIDTPNSVLRRVLELEREDEGSRKFTFQIGKPPRAARGTAITQADFEVPILEVLEQLGGSARREDALRKLEHYLRDRLNDVDIVRSKRLMDAARSNISDQQRQVFCELTLDIEVPLHDVAARGIRLNRRIAQATRAK